MLDVSMLQSVLQGHFNEDEMNRIAIFISIDTNHNGVLETSEREEAMSKLSSCLSAPPEDESCYPKYDFDGSGTINVLDASVLVAVFQNHLNKD